MRIVRYQTAGGEPRCGWIQDDLVGDIDGDLFGPYMRREAKTPISDVRLLAPILPGKIVCVGRNYVEHAKELGNDVPKIPLIFLKPPSSILGPGEAIVLPPQSKQVEHEAELVVVIGKRGRNITAEQAGEYVLGYTVGNDVSDRAAQRGDGQWCRAKSFDTFCPFGPFIETDINPDNVHIETRVNGQLKQNSNTNDMIFGVRHLISFLSRSATLLPGDIIMTGTPQGVGPIKPGDVVEISIEGIGTLRNPVK